MVLPSVKGFDDIVDLKIGWPKIYRQIKDDKWFNALAMYYSTSISPYSSKTNYKNTPLILLDPKVDEEDKEVDKILGVICDSSTEPQENLEWWIMLNNSIYTNGVFLYCVMRYMGYMTKIYEDKGHVYLRDGANRVVDLYQVFSSDQSLDISGYTSTKEIFILDLLDKYDILRKILSERSLHFIFKDGIINLHMTRPLDFKMKSLINKICKGIIPFSKEIKEATKLKPIKLEGETSEDEEILEEEV